MSDDLSAPGKLYEYLGTGRPILGLVPAGSQAKRAVLRDYGAGIAVAPKDTKAIADAIVELYAKWKP